MSCSIIQHSSEQAVSTVSVKHASSSLESTVDLFRIADVCCYLFLSAPREYDLYVGAHSLLLASFAPGEGGGGLQTY